MSAAAGRGTAGNIASLNPHSGLSNDYLNHFTEAIMTLEMAAMMPECIDDLRAWRPKTYREHFVASRYAWRDAAIAAYDALDPAVKGPLDDAARTLNAVLVNTRESLLAKLGTPDAEALAKRAATWLRPLVSRIAAIINGGSIADESIARQAAIDELLAR